MFTDEFDNEFDEFDFWQEEFDLKLPLLGHRNWILVVDKAYPLQSAPGIEYIDSQQDIDKVLDYVLNEIDESSHVRPIIYTDKELEVLPQIGKEEAEMVSLLKEVIGDREIQSIPHEEIFTKLDTASKLFNVLVIKTESTIAYSSVFIELDCGYWSAEKEAKLRNLMK